MTSSSSPWVIACVIVLMFAMATPSTLHGATPGFDEYALLKSMPADVILKTKQEIPNADGYTGGNTVTNFRADNQRSGMFTFVVGIVNGIDSYVEAGWRAIDVTYNRHQTAAGDFGQEGANACHFFMSWSNHALNLLRNSPYAAAYKDRLDALLPKIQLATDYLAAHRADMSGDFGSPNRTMINANIFAFGYLLLKGYSSQTKVDSYYNELAWWMNNEFVSNAYSGTKLYRELDGVFLEGGGYDTGYDATGLYMFLHIVCYFPNEPFLPDAIARGAKGGQFLIKRVLPNGTIDGTFNTRSGPGNEAGDAKNTNLTELRLGLIYYAMMFNNQEAKDDLTNTMNAVSTTTVNGLPPVIFSPGTAVAQVGTPFTYTILATNSPPANRDTTSPPSVISVSGQPAWLQLGATGGLAKSTSYRTLSGIPTQAGTYTFTVASNNPSGIAQGTGSATITLTVDPASGAGTAPTITTQPANRSVTVGATATFSVAATGIPAPTSQWQKNNVNISGASSTSYTTPTTVISDNGATYRCVVTNSAGTATSTSATLTVTAVVVVPPTPAAPTVSSAGTATPTLSGISDAGATIRIYAGATLIGTVTANGSGAWTFSPTLTPGTHQITTTATNSAGTSATSPAVSVVIPSTTAAPTITTQPANQSVAVGATAMFSVTATGTPAPTYQWQKNTVAIGGATSATYTIPATVSGDNGATYRCVATNSAGTVTSTNATLSVTAVPAPAPAPVPATSSSNSKSCGMGSFAALGAVLGLMGLMGLMGLLRRKQR